MTALWHSPGSRPSQSKRTFEAWKGSLIRLLCLPSTTQQFDISESEQQRALLVECACKTTGSHDANDWDLKCDVAFWWRRMLRHMERAGCLVIVQSTCVFDPAYRVDISLIPVILRCVMSICLSESAAAWATSPSLKLATSSLPERDEITKVVFVTSLFVYLSPLTLIFSPACCLCEDEVASLQVLFVLREHVFQRRLVLETFSHHLSIDYEWENRENWYNIEFTIIETYSPLNYKNKSDKHKPT